MQYAPLDELYRESDILSLHGPLTPETHHLVDAPMIARMKRGVMLVNTGRGALIDSRALIDALKTGQVGSAGLDVYEEEEAVFFRDLSDRVLKDDVLARLLTFPNVLITSHQGFLTREALAAIAATTLEGAPLICSCSPTSPVLPTKAPRPRAGGWPQKSPCPSCTEGSRSTAGADPSGS